MKSCYICHQPFQPRRKNQRLCGNPDCVKKLKNEIGNRSRQKRIDAGLCRNCFQRPVEPGRKQCSVCLQKDASVKDELRKTHPGYNMYQNTKRRAKELGIPFELTLEDVDRITPELCPVLGIKLSQGRKYICDTSPTLDKIIPNKGYIKGNVVVMSRRANMLKNNATIQELVLLGEWAKCQAE